MTTPVAFMCPVCMTKSVTKQPGKCYFDCDRDHGTPRIALFSKSSDGACSPIIVVDEQLDVKPQISMKHFITKDFVTTEGIRLKAGDQICVEAGDETKVICSFMTDNIYYSDNFSVPNELVEEHTFETVFKGKRLMSK